MDGSARRFVQAILRDRPRALPGDLEAIRVLKPVREGEGDVLAELRPAETLSIDFEIDFADAAIGRQAAASSWSTAPSCTNSPTAAPSAAATTSR